MGKGSIKMTTTTDHTEIRDSADDDVQSEPVLQSAFWNDLARELAEPEFLRVYAEESARISIIDALTAEWLRAGVEHEIAPAPAAQSIWDFTKAEEES